MIRALLLAVAATLAAIAVVWLALILTLTRPATGAPYTLLIVAAALVVAHTFLSRLKGTRP